MKYLDVSIKSRSDSSCGPRGAPPPRATEMFTRRTATVIISAPDASCAFTMIDGDEYFPVPTMSRELKVLPAIENVSMWTVRGWLSATYEVHDFNLVALAHDDLVEGRALEDDQIVFDRHAPR